MRRSDLWIATCLWASLFATAMWLAARNGFQDLWLFAAAMGLSLWGLCDALLLVARTTREYLASRRAPTAHADAEIGAFPQGSVTRSDV